MDRRAFLARLGFGTVAAAAAVLSFDVERLLWVPGEKTILLPSDTIGYLSIDSVFKVGDVVTFTGYNDTCPQQYFVITGIASFTATITATTDYKDLITRSLPDARQVKKSASINGRRRARREFPESQEAPRVDVEGPTARLCLRL